MLQILSHFATDSDKLIRYKYNLIHSDYFEVWLKTPFNLINNAFKKDIWELKGELRKIYSVIINERIESDLEVRGQSYIHPLS